MPKDHSLTKKQKEKIVNTMKSLERFEDKVWLYLHLASRNYIMESDYFTGDERDSLESTNENRDIKNIKNYKNIKNSLSESEAVQLREALGLPGEIGVSDSDTNFMLEVEQMLCEEIYADGTEKAKQEVYTKLFAVEMKILMDIAAEVEENKKYFAEDDPYREWKAIYITNKSLTTTGLLDRGLLQGLYNTMGSVESDTNHRQTLSEDEYAVFKKMNVSPESRLTPEEQKMYSLGKLARNEIKFPHVKVPGKDYPVRDPILEQWVKESGDILVQNITKEKMVEGYQMFSNKILNYKPEFFKNTETLNSYYKNEIESTNLMIIRGAKNQLVDTIDKKGRKNAPLFEKIVQDVKNLDSLISGGEYTKAHLVKETLGKECLKYMVGKEKVRRSDYGRDRIDAILVIMSEILTDRQFRQEIERINTVRGAKPGQENYINIEDYKHPTAETAKGDFTEGDIYRDFVQKAIKKEAERYDKVDSDRTLIPETYKENLAAIEGLYGRTLDTKNKKLMAAFDGIGGNSKVRTFKPINDEFVAVGKYGASGRNLSEKDFVAIAYAGALTPEAAAKDPRFADAKPEDKAIYTGVKYTTKIGSVSIDADTKKYSDVIQFGRTSAAEAMKEYQKGNKKPLAHILASGIKTICDKAKNADKLNYMTIGEVEMLNRMTDMMYRDTDLFILANKEGVGNEYLHYGKGLKVASHIIATGNNAHNKMEQAENSKTKLTKAERLKAVTDMVVIRILDESYNMTNRKLLQNPEYKKELKAIEDKYKKDVAPINAEIAKNMVGKEYFERRAQLFDQKQKLDEYLEYNKGALRQKYLPENKLMESLTSIESYKKLRQDVAKFVEKTGIYKKSNKDIIKAIDDKKFASNMQKIVEENSAKSAPAVKTNEVKKQTPQKTQQTPGLS